MANRNTIIYTLNDTEITLTDANLYGGVKYKYTMGFQGNIELGATPCAEIKFTTDRYIPIDTMLVYKTLCNDDVNPVETTHDYIVGNFWIESVTRNTTDNSHYDIVAYDGISKFDKDVSEWSRNYPTVYRWNYFSSQRNDSIEPFTKSLANTSQTFDFYTTLYANKNYTFSYGGKTTITCTPSEIINYIDTIKNKYYVDNTQNPPVAVRIPSDISKITYTNNTLTIDGVKYNVACEVKYDFDQNKYPADGRTNTQYTVALPIDEDCMGTPLMLLENLMEYCCDMDVWSNTIYDKSDWSLPAINNLYNYPVYKNWNDNLPLNGRDILSYVAQLCCGWAQITFENVSEAIHPALAICSFGCATYTDGDYNLDSSHFTQRKIGEYIVPKITKLWVGAEDGDVGFTAGNGDNLIKIEANPLFYRSESDAQIQLAVDNIYEDLDSIYAYTPVTIKTFYPMEADNFFESIGFTSTNPDDANNPYHHVITSVEWDNSGCTYTSKGLASREKEVVYVDAATKKNNARYNKLVRDVNETKSEVATMDGRLTTVTQTADGINAVCQGKATFTKSGTAPTDPNIGDVWQNTSVTPNTFWRYNNEQWISITESEAKNLEVVNSISQTMEGVAFTSSLADGTTLINGGCITTGKISANYINCQNVVDAATITADDIYAGKLHGREKSHSVGIDGSLTVYSGNNLEGYLGGYYLSPSSNGVWIANSTEENTIEVSNDNANMSYVPASGGSITDAHVQVGDFGVSLLCEGGDSADIDIEADNDIIVKAGNDINLSRGSVVINNWVYGPTLPASGTRGQIFFVTG